MNWDTKMYLHMQVTFTLMVQFCFARHFVSNSVKNFNLQMVFDPK